MGFGSVSSLTLNVLTYKMGTMASLGEWCKKMGGQSFFSPRTPLVGRIFPFSPPKTLGFSKRTSEAFDHLLIS